VCKQHYSVIHPFYDSDVSGCAEFNFNKRTELADLRGRVALLTGGRVKIGYQTGLKLLRAGARTGSSPPASPPTPRSVMRANQTSPSGGSPEIFGLDLRHTPVLKRSARICWQLFRGSISLSTRLPDRSPSTGVYKHMLQGDKNGRIG